MANTFYYNACEMDAKMSPVSYVEEIEKFDVDEGTDGNGLRFYRSASDRKLYAPSAIMNENVAINYRSIYNSYPTYAKNVAFTDYDDYLKCIQKDEMNLKWLKAKQNPTYKNIISWYGDPLFDPYGLAAYKMQDFIYLKYYNQIPNNYMVTLRRYTRPCVDNMFGLDYDASVSNAMNGNPESYFALATAVTYMGDKAGNKLSEILKFDYGMNWEDKEAKVETLKNSDGGLAQQLQQNGVRQRQKTTESMMSATTDRMGMRRNATDSIRQALVFSAAVQGKKGAGSTTDAIASMHAYEGDEFAARYGEEFYGDVNVVNKVKMRSRGLTFTNSFSLNFEYSLKSLKCVNPRVAMLDILGNFMILTGNYGNFWGGATLFYGQHSIAPQYGDPELLRKGQYGKYLHSLWDDVKTGYERLATKENGEKGGFLTALGNIAKGGFQDLIGNLLGGNVGVAGQAQAPPALLSGNPSGYWHVTVGNPLDPIAMMGNMCVTKTSVQFNDILGYDDFPTEVKFTVELEHGRARDNAFIQSMFNAGKGRIYSFNNKGLEDAMHNVDVLNNFQVNADQNRQEMSVTYDKNGIPQNVGGRMVGLDQMKVMGGNLYN
jgi:hypothetical protein